MENYLLFSSILLWVIMLFNLLLTLALVRRVNMPSGELIETLEIGQTAPQFIAEALIGEQVALADFAGRGLALVFVSPNCSHCRPHIPILENLGPKAKRYGTELILVCDADIDKTRAYVQELNITLPVLSAPRQTNPFFEEYKAGGVPFYAIIDNQGKILASGGLGNLNWEKFIELWKNELKPALQALETTYNHT
jgi:peroxiredoxin